MTISSFRTSPGHIIETYDDRRSWVLWLLYTIAFLFQRCGLSRTLAAKKVEADLNSGLKETPVEVPNQIQNDFVFSLLADAECRTHVMENPRTIGSSSPPDVIIYFHGGAYIYNLTANHFNFAGKVLTSLSHKAICFLPEYPVAPHATYDKMIPICEAVYHRIVAAHPNHRIVLMGDSSGGGISLILAQTLATSKKDVPLPHSVVLLSPWLDMSMSDPESTELMALDPLLDVNGLKRAGLAFAGGPCPVSLKDPHISPLYGPLDGLPPVSLFTSSHDVLLPDSKRLLARYKREGIPSRFRYNEKRGLLHCYYFFPRDDAAIGDIVKAIEEDLSSYR